MILNYRKNLENIFFQIHLMYYAAEIDEDSDLAIKHGLRI